MTKDQFWSLIDTAHDGREAATDAGLLERLTPLSESEILAFSRHWIERYFELYTWPLRGVVHLVEGTASEEAFVEWRIWIIASGRRAFETALHHPDRLGPWIEAKHGKFDGFIERVIARALCAKDPRWAAGPPEHGLVHPAQPTGERWSGKYDLAFILPSLSKRYSDDGRQQAEYSAASRRTIGLVLLPAGLALSLAPTGLQMLLGLPPWPWLILLFWLAIIAALVTARSSPSNFKAVVTTLTVLLLLNIGGCARLWKDLGTIQ